MKGAKVAVIDPSPIALTRISDAWVKITPGSDAAFFNGIAAQLIADKKSDPEAGNIDGLSGSKADALAASGADEKDVDKFYKLFADASSVAVIFGTGLSGKTESMEALLNLCIVKGIQKTGAVMPTALQSNAVGILAVLPDAVSTSDVLSKADGLLIYEDDPFHYLAGKSVEQALKNKAFLAVCDMFDTSASQYAHIVVPTGSFAQKEGSYVAEDGYMRKVVRAEGKASPGFEFLRMLLDRLGGGLYKNEAEASTVIFGREILISDDLGRASLRPTNGTAKIAPPGKAESGKSRKTVYPCFEESLLPSSPGRKGRLFQNGLSPEPPDRRRQIIHLAGRCRGPRDMRKAARSLSNRTMGKSSTLQRSRKA